MKSLVTQHSKTLISPCSYATMSSPLESPFNHSGAASATLSSSDSTAEAAFARENFDMDLDLGQGSDYDRLLESVLSSQGL